MPSATTAPLELAPRTSLTALPHTAAGKALLVVAATGLVALCAHLSVPLFFTPVPLTLQTFAVLLTGLALGPAAGFSAMVLYLAEGAAGLPVFSPHGPGGLAQLLGPTGGFLLSYPLAAAAAGAVVRFLPATLSRFTSGVLGGLAATVFIFAFGAGWLAHLLHLSLSAAFAFAVSPFLVGEMLKITAAAALFSGLGRIRRA